MHQLKLKWKGLQSVVSIESQREINNQEVGKTHCREGNNLSTFRLHDFFKFLANQNNFLISLVGRIGIEPMTKRLRVSGYGKPALHTLIILNDHNKYNYYPDKWHSLSNKLLIIA
jgi:hypothetical protein